MALRACCSCAVPSPSPDLNGGRAEFNKITVRTALGFIVMGFIGFFVKLIFIVSALLAWPGRAGALPCRTCSVLRRVDAHPAALTLDVLWVQPINQIIVGGAAA